MCFISCIFKIVGFVILLIGLFVILIACGVFKSDNRNQCITQKSKPDDLREESAEVDGFSIKLKGYASIQEEENGPIAYAKFERLEPKFQASLNGTLRFDLNFSCGYIWFDLYDKEIGELSVGINTGRYTKNHKAKIRIDQRIKSSNSIEINSQNVTIKDYSWFYIEKLVIKQTSLNDVIKR